MATKKSKKSVQPNWRPNFRVEEKLPDIKVIRTGFLLNVAVIVIMFGLVGAVGYNEYKTRSKSASLEELRATYEESTPINRRRITLNNEFKDIALNFEELERFLNTSLTPAELMQLISQTQPPQSLISQLELRGVTERVAQEDIFFHRIEITGTMVASDTEREPRLIDNFYNALIDSEALKPLLREHELSFQRDDQLGVFNYTIRININLDPASEAAASS